MPFIRETASLLYLIRSFLPQKHNRFIAYTRLTGSAFGAGSITLYPRQSLNIKTGRKSKNIAYPTKKIIIDRIFSALFLNLAIQSAKAETVDKKIKYPIEPVFVGSL
jgi:hypothetical protein